MTHEEKIIYWFDKAVCFLEVLILVAFIAGAVFFIFAFLS